MDASLIDDFPAESAMDFDVNRFAVPDAQYRITVIPGDAEDSENGLIWHYAEAASVTDPNVDDSNLASDRRLMFSLLGTEAWTYHTWLESSEGAAPDATKRQPGDRVEGLPNRIRYAIGGDFETPAAELRPELRPLENGDTEVPFRYTQRTDLADVTLFVETSIDLETWTTVDSGDIQSLGPASGGEESFEARVPYNGDRVFLRLQADPVSSP